MLATDLAFNFPTINAFKQMLADRQADGTVRRSRYSAAVRVSHSTRLSATTTEDRASSTPRGFARAGSDPVESFSAAEKLLVLKMAIKVSDIGNVTKGRDYCLGWTKRVTEEFFHKGDLEAKLGLPVTPFMDRTTANIPKQQIGFYNFVAKPMFEAMGHMVSMDRPLANLQRMIDHWSAQLPTDEAAAIAPPSRASRLSRSATSHSPQGGASPAASRSSDSPGSRDPHRKSPSFLRPGRVAPAND